MPSVEIKEGRRMQIAKFPVRTVSFTVSKVGLAIKGMGLGLVKVGDVMDMGKSSEWVGSGDVDAKTGKKVDWSKNFEQESQERCQRVDKARKEHAARVLANMKFWEKREKWADTVKDVEKGSLSDVSTLKGSEYGDEKALMSEKEFWSLFEGL